MYGMDQVSQAMADQDQPRNALAELDAFAREHMAQ